MAFFCVGDVLPSRIYTLWLLNIAMENGPYFPINTSIYKGFAMAMLNNQMVYIHEIERGNGNRQRFDTSNLEPRISNLESPISDLESRTSNLESPITNQE
jgi:hypothetical protein